MQSRSRAVNSSQSKPHPDLIKKVQRHIHSPWQRPVANHTQRVWREVFGVLSSAPDQPIVLDSGCGTGASAWRLSQIHPACWIVAVDQSAHRLRLENGFRRHKNIIWVRAELGDLWHLMRLSGVKLGAHYILYPNPWPKKRHLQRRWHGHPAFIDMLQLGGCLEARSNWKMYLDELALAILYATGASAEPQIIRAPGLAPYTPFEKKYAESGQRLYRLQINLRGLNPSMGQVINQIDLGDDRNQSVSIV